MKFNRRQFLKGSAVAGGGLVLGFHLTGCDDKPFPGDSGGDLRPNAFVQIDAAGDVVFYLHKAEMGQGVYTGMTTILAEELKVDPRRIEVRFAQVHPAFKDPEFMLMTTGGSTSVKNSYDMLRQAGASARAMLVAAAAQRWQVAAADLSVEDGVITAPDGSSAGYGEWVAEARTQSVPSDPPLTDPAEFRYIGRFNERLDARVKVDGSARFGIDITVPDALTAVVVRNPQFDAGWESYDAEQTRAVKGVRELVELPHGIAVVATGYWAARKGADALKVKWEPGSSAGLTGEKLRTEQRRMLDEGEAESMASRGEPVDRGEAYEVEYSVPYLAHATLEPQNCVADVRDGDVHVWLGNQGPDTIQDSVARALDRPREEITVHNAMLGGGFGRRIQPDSAVEAVLISRQLQRPVKLVWSREDDTRHDFYRPAAMARMSARMDAGRVLSWRQRFVCPSISRTLMPLFMRSAMPAWIPEGVVGAATGFMGTAMFAGEGATDQPYQSEHFEVEHIQHDMGVPVGFWRSVGHSYNAFFVEGFIDELAHAAGVDPVQFRLNHLAPDARERTVLELAAEKAGWGQAPEGRHHGVAVHTSFDTAVAQVAEVSMQNGELKIHRVVCAVDCGRVINPDVVAAQVEGGVVFGLTAALYGDIDFEDGAVKQSNFHDYPMLRMHEMPEVEVHIVESSNPSSGIGEPGVPPIAPALANAIHAASGRRLRRLPLQLS